jgi:hypothetical protein
MQRAHSLLDNASHDTYRGSAVVIAVHPISDHCVLLRYLVWRLWRLWRLRRQRECRLRAGSDFAGVGKNLHLVAAARSTERLRSDGITTLLLSVSTNSTNMMATHHPDAPPLRLVAVNNPLVTLTGENMALGPRAMATTVSSARALGRAVMVAFIVFDAELRIGGWRRC